jgi:TraB family protein
MHRALTTLLAVICGSSLGIASAQTSEAPLDEVIVTGEFVGPGMWQVSHPDHPGHTLWIVGEPPPLPQGMHFHSQKVERVASQSQEVLMQPGFSLKPAEKIGVWRMLTLVPAALKLRKNPDKATLKDLLSADVYARWLVQKKLYLGHDAGLEKMRPMVVADKLSNAAFKKLRLGNGGSWGGAWKQVRDKKIPVTTPSLDFTFKTDNLRGQIKAFARQKLADEECLAKTIELTEALSNKPVEEARARAWATADLARLRELPPLPNPDPYCEKAIVDSLAMTTPVPANIRETLDELWLDAAGDAVTKNVSTLGFVKMSDLLGEQGYLENLRKRGYQILAPDAESP